MRSSRSRLRFGRALVLWIPLLAAWACGGSDKEKVQAAGLAQGCTVNSDCRNPLVCTFERCHEECEEDRDCTRGEERCVMGADAKHVCQLPVETGCTKNAQCNGDQVCGDDGECRDVCTTAKDCIGDQICATSGECASSDPDKDTVDDTGAIVPDPYDDTTAGGATGTGGRSSTGGTGGKSSTGGSTSMGGTTGEGGAGGAAGSGTAGSGTEGGSAGAGGGGTGECPAGFADCDSDPSDCETSLALVTSCGACDVACDPAHGKVKCDETTLTCVIDVTAGGCTTGYDDCNMDGKDGCEANLATDSENCGKCGVNCGTGTCTNKQCGSEILMKPVNSSTVTYSWNGEAQLVGTKLFKLNYDNGSEVKTVTLPAASPPGEGTVFVAATSGTTIQSTHADGTNFYYAIGGSPASILYKPLTGTAATAAKTAVNMPDANPATLISSSSTALYMVAASKILTAQKPSGATATNAGVITGLEAVGTVYDLLVAGQRLFWVQYTGSEHAVYTAPFTGGTPVALDTTIGNANYAKLASDGTYVYWNTYNGASSKIRCVAIAGSPTAAKTLDVAVGLNSPYNGITADEGYVYYHESNQLYRVSTTEMTAPEPLANLTASPYIYDLFAVDDAYLYGTGYYGELLRSSKDAVSTP